MDKCILSEKDVNYLFQWRDNNINLIERFPNPISAIEVHIKSDLGLKIKYFRDEKNDNKLTVHLNIKGKSYGSSVYYRRPWDGKFNIDQTRNHMRPLYENDKYNQKMFIQSILSLYMCLVALMSYGDNKFNKQEMDYLDKQNRTARLKKNSKKKINKNSYTYILLKNKNGNMCIKNKEKHNSPSCQFSVRGHFRHYKNGKIIWIDEYQKCVNNDKKSKVYKISSKNNLVGE